MNKPLRYSATKVVGEYGDIARKQERLHLQPDNNGKWVKYKDFKNVLDYASQLLQIIKENHKEEIK